MDQKYTADIVIIGGGVIGCSTAYNLANQGAKKLCCWKREIFVQEVQPNPVRSHGVITLSNQICIMQLKV